VHLRYEGSDTALPVPFGSLAEMQSAYDEAYQSRFGFLMPGKGLVAALVSVESIGHTFQLESDQISAAPEAPQVDDVITAYMADDFVDTPVYQREKIMAGQRVTGPALIIEPTGTNVIEPGWEAEMTPIGNLVVRRVVALQRQDAIGTDCDPVMLEVFNNLFMSIAEQMGYTLQNTALSVNVKERLDFSCAIFDATGALIANAPHMPVHLGSMGESVRAVLRDNAGNIAPGDAYVLNNP
jgi:5-oxoprolinase (ATP-hydrolysing)